MATYGVPACARAAAQEMQVTQCNNAYNKVTLNKHTVLLTSLTTVCMQCVMPKMHKDRCIITLISANCMALCIIILTPDPD